MKSALVIIGIILIVLLSNIIPIATSYKASSNNIIYVDDDGTADYTKIQDEINNANDVELETLIFYVGFIYNLNYFDNSGGFYIFNCTSVLAIYWIKGYGFHMQIFNSGDRLMISLDYIEVDVEFLFKGYIGERVICGIQIVKY